MKVRVYVRLEHHAYARSSVEEVRAHAGDQFPEGLNLNDGWVWFLVEIEDNAEAEDAQENLDIEMGNRGRAYH